VISLGLAFGLALATFIWLFLFRVPLVPTVELRTQNFPRQEFRPAIDSSREEAPSGLIPGLQHLNTDLHIDNKRIVGVRRLVAGIQRPDENGMVESASRRPSSVKVLTGTSFVTLTSGVYLVCDLQDASGGGAVVPYSPNEAQRDWRDARSLTRRLDSQITDVDLSLVKKPQILVGDDGIVLGSLSSFASLTGLPTDYDKGDERKERQQAVRDEGLRFALAAFGAICCLLLQLFGALWRTRHSDVYSRCGGWGLQFAGTVGLFVVIGTYAGGWGFWGLL
jgi:hypothetical protein